MNLKKHMPFKIDQHFALLIFETGRYENIALNDRICHLCDYDSVEDERHFLIS